MQVLRNKASSLGAVALFGMSSATVLTGCPDLKEPCGPCGSVLEGSVSIVNNARVDGFFRAIADLNGVFVSVNADFEANIRALAEVWGYTQITAETAINAEAVAGLMTHIEGQIRGSISGSLTINYAPPRCSADVNVAVEAQAQCEVQAECEVDVDAGEVSVTCEGQCSGGCSGTCEGAVACKVEGGVSCEGSCEGSCEIMGSASCEGTCRGQCSGMCSTGDPDNCAGSCDGMCSGTCEVSAGASCSGRCHGTCVTEAPSAECDATAECRASCSGECSGSCEGTARPPSASADCEASADCQASASAQASAKLECTPPSLEINFAFGGDIAGDASAEAAFMAKITELRVRAAAILQGFAQLKGLIDGDFNGDGTAEVSPAPFARIQGEFSALVDAAVAGEVKVAAGLVPCLVPAVREAAELLGDVGANAGGTIRAQAEFSVGLFAIAG